MSAPTARAPATEEEIHRNRSLCKEHIDRVTQCMLDPVRKRMGCDALERALTWCVLSAFCPSEAQKVSGCMEISGSLRLREPISWRCRWAYVKV